MNPAFCHFAMVLFFALHWILADLATAEEALPFESTKAQQQYPRVREARKAHLSDIQALFAKQTLPYPPAEVLIRVFKQEDQLELWVRGSKQNEFVLLKSYAICQRSGTLGPKRRQGDLQVPEGFYQVTQFHPDSTYHLSLRLNYPNASDRLRSDKTKPGGDILIHGDCVTIGCIPLTDQWIEELYLIALDSFSKNNVKTMVHIFPFRLNDAMMEKARVNFSSQKELLSFWEELKIGFDIFERQHIPLVIKVGKNGTYLFEPKK